MCPTICSSVIQCCVCFMYHERPEKTVWILVKLAQILRCRCLNQISLYLGTSVWWLQQTWWQALAAVLLLPLVVPLQSGELLAEQLFKSLQVHVVSVRHYRKGGVIFLVFDPFYFHSVGQLVLLSFYRVILLYGSLHSSAFIKGSEKILRLRKSSVLVKDLLILISL